MTNADIFIDSCSEQGVRLADALYERLLERDQPTSNVLLWSPSFMLSAVAAAGEMLRMYPKVKLADGLIAVPSELGEDTAAATLTEIVNHSLVPDRSYPSFKSKQVDVEACDDAEYHFVKLFDSMKALANGERQIDFFGSQIIVDGNEPLMIRKSGQFHSAINLKQLVINGVPYPAGSLLASAIKDNTGKPQYFVDPHRIEIIPKERITRIGFMRLSAFALKQSERAAVPRRILDARRPDLIDRFQSLDIAEVTDIVNNAVGRPESRKLAA